MIKLTIEKDPIPAARPRFNSQRGGVYQPTRTVEYRKEVEQTARLAMKSRPPMTGALEAEINLYRRYRPTSKRFGDCDNHLKALFDGLNGIVFVDDSQLVRVTVTKHEDKTSPRAEIILSEA